MKLFNIIVSVLSFFLGIASIFMGVGLYFSDALSSFGDKGIFLGLYLSVGILFAFISFRIEKVLRIQQLTVIILSIFWGSFFIAYTSNFGINNKYTLLCAAPFVICILKLLIYKKSSSPK